MAVSSVSLLSTPAIFTEAEENVSHDDLAFAIVVIQLPSFLCLLLLCLEKGRVSLVPDPAIVACGHVRLSSA